jgi:hypothetical protein
VEYSLNFGLTWTNERRERTAKARVVQRQQDILDEGVYRSAPYYARSRQIRVCNCQGINPYAYDEMDRNLMQSLSKLICIAHKTLGRRMKAPSGSETMHVCVPRIQVKVPKFAPEIWIANNYYSPSLPIAAIWRKSRRVQDPNHEFITHRLIGVVTDGGAGLHNVQKLQVIGS